MLRDLRPTWMFMDNMIKIVTNHDRRNTQVTMFFKNEINFLDFHAVIVGTGTYENISFHVSFSYYTTVGLILTMLGWFQLYNPS